jgi:hypothetical protein
MKNNLKAKSWRHISSGRSLAGMNEALGSIHNTAKI